MQQRRVSGAAAILLSAAFISLWLGAGIESESRLLEEEADHDSLFPLSSRDVWAFSLASIGLVVAAGGGIGGGGMLVPIYILVLQFPTKHAIPLSNVTVFGGAVANTMLNVRKRHPLADRPLIDWDLILVMEPLTILGALIGTFIHKVLNEIIIVILLALLLSFIAYKTLAKAVKLYEKEDYVMVKSSDDATDSDDKVGLSQHELELTKIKKGAMLAPTDLLRNVSDDGAPSHRELLRRRSSLCRKSSGMDSSTHEEMHSFGSCDTMSLGSQQGSFDAINAQSSSSPRDEPVGDETINPLLVQILEEERHVRFETVGVIVSLFVVVLIMNILKGGGAFPSPIGIECGSPLFWIAEGSIALCILLVSWYARSILLRRARRKQDARYQYLECDIEWNASSALIYPLLSCSAGLVAGLFGIGGGIIKGPLMLALGVHPAIASATSACMILFTSFTAMASFAVFGLLVRDYAILCLIIGFVATLMGQTIMSLIFQRCQRNSYIAFCIGTVVLLSAICITLESVISLLRGGASQRSVGDLCSAHLGRPSP